MKVSVFNGARRIQPSSWFGQGPPGVSEFSPETPDGPPGASLGLQTRWPGGGPPTALVLGPSSWGFGIGPWGGTAFLRSGW
jgi:hypothetical protein